jgi:hypothetical protein
MLMLATLLLVSCRGRASASADSLPEQAASSMRSDVEYLASDELAGRLIGEPGVTVAEEYIAARFADAGLAPLPGLDDFYHEFSVERTIFSNGQVLVAIDGVESYRAVSGVGITVLKYSGLARLQTELVYAGYGIHAPDAEYEDYEGLDVTGKVVVVLRGEPPASDRSWPFGRPGGSIHAYQRTKAQVARRNGAAGIIIVNPVSRAETPADFALTPLFRIDSSWYRAPPQARMQVASDYPVLLSSSDLLVWLAVQSGTTAASLETAANEGVPPANLSIQSLPVTVDVEGDRVDRGVPARNVTGAILSEPSDEWVIIGAHHDHMGAYPGPGDLIYNGADDNASGVSVILDLARTLADMKLARNVALVTFSGEEHGLFGSSVFVASGLLDPEGVVAMINVDMAARNSGQPVTVYTSRQFPLRSTDLEELAGAAGLPVVMHVGAMGRDDSLPFQMSGIPTMFPFSGFHGDYHGVDDESDRLDYDRLGRLSMFVRAVVLDLAGH